jgi:hypothetical protein
VCFAIGHKRTARHQRLHSHTEAPDRDGDYERALALTPRAREFCAQTVRFRENKRTWTLQVIEGRAPGPLWFAPHDDENSGFDAGLYGLERYGGVFVAVDVGFRRDNEGVDPNRLFGAIQDDCRGQRAAPVYTNTIMARHVEGAPIIALHSNGWDYSTDDASTGDGDVSITFPDTERRMSFAATDPLPDPSAADDTLIYLPGSPPKPSPANALIIGALNAARINVIYEMVQPSSSNCSFSNHAFLNHHTYFNIEVVDGDAATQILILDELMSILTRPV